MSTLLTHAEMKAINEKVIGADGSIDQSAFFEAIAELTKPQITQLALHLQTEGDKALLDAKTCRRELQRRKA